MTKEELRKEFEATSEYYAIYQDMGVLTPTMEYTEWLESRLANEGKYSEEQVYFAYKLGNGKNYADEPTIRHWFYEYDFPQVKSLTAAPSKEGGDR